MKKRLMIMIVAILLFGVLLVAVLAMKGDNADKNHEAKMDLAVQYLAEKDYDNAIVAYSAVIEIDPKCVDAYLGAVQAHVAMKEYEAAIEILDSAIAMGIRELRVYTCYMSIYIDSDCGNLDLVEEIVRSGQMVINDSEDSITQEERNAFINAVVTYYQKNAEKKIEQGDKENGIALLEKVYEITAEEVVKGQIEDLRLEIEKELCSGMAKGQETRVNSYWLEGESMVLYAHYKNTYDESGRRIRMSGFYGESEEEEWYEEYIYDGIGNHVGTRCYSKPGTLSGYYMNTFDENGNCIKEEYFGAEGTLESCYVSEYSESGKIMQTSHYSFTMSNYYDTDKPLGICDYIYDEEGRLWREEWQYQGVEGECFYTEYAYNEDGLCTRRSEGMGDEVHYYTEYEYDENGLCMKTIYCDGKGTVTAYDEHLFDEDQYWIPMNTHFNFTGYYIIA